ncbi:hypothetical protein D3C74_372530 [compost metagenome]
MQALLLELGLAAARVGEVRVAGVDDDVALLEERDQLGDDGVRRAAGLDHDDDLAGTLERGDEVGHRLGRDEVAVVAVVGDERLGLGEGAVVHRDRVAVTSEVAGQVAAHDRESGDADLCAGCHLLCSSGVGAGSGEQECRAPAGHADDGRRRTLPTA